MARTKPSLINLGPLQATASGGYRGAVAATES
jgi:hypothetical protein